MAVVVRRFVRMSDLTDHVDNGVHVQPQPPAAHDNACHTVSFLIADTEIKAKTYTQETEPSLASNEVFAFWKKSDTGQIFFVYRRSVGDQVSVELA